MNVWLGRRCRCMTGISPWSFPPGIIVVDPFLSSVTIRCKKFFRLCHWSNCSHVHKQRSMSFDFNLYGTQLPCFWVIPRARQRLATVERSTSNDSASFSCVWDESWSSNASSSSSSNLFGCPVRSLFLISLSSFLKRLNHSKHCFLDKACSPYFSTSKRWLSAAVFFEK